MQDFLTFQSFITPTLLIIMYYMGVILIPVLCLYFTFWIKKTYLPDVSQALNTYLTTKQRFILSISFLLMLLFMEIFWRVLFEFFIAYFDMHDALMKINSMK